MPHCDSFYRALDRKLEQRMTIDEIAKELCDKTKDPRRNMILDIKEHKGEKWLNANADWLGYQIQKHEKAKVTSDCDLLPITPTSTTSITSVAPEATVSDKVVKDTKKEIDTIPVVDLYIDPIIPISSIPAMAIVPGTIISDTSSTEVKESKETIDQPIKETVGWVENKYKDTKSVLPLPITDQPSPPTPLPTSCIVGKQIPDCNICELGFSDNEKWHCDDFNLLCSAKSCLVGKYIEDKRTCSSCNFKTHLKKVFWYHVKLVHKDNEGLMNQVREEIKQYIIQHKLSAIVICPGCGYGFDTGKQVFLTKKELDNIRSFQSAPPEIRETVNNINLKLI